MQKPRQSHPFFPTSHLPPEQIFFTILQLMLSYFSPPCRANVYNADARYGRWPNPARIPYTTEMTPFSLIDQTTLRNAMNQINSDTGGCIQFQPYDAAIDRGQDFIVFRPRLTAGIIDICYTFPGLVRNNGFGQVAVIFSSTGYAGTSPVSNVPGPGMPGACLDNQRETMRLLMHLLGLRSEHNRPDRDTYLTFQSRNPNTLVPETLRRYNLFIAYNASTPVAIASVEFDYQSITLVTGDKFAASSTVPVFVPTAGNSIGQLARLSRADCLMVNQLYGCNAPCPDPYSASGGVSFNNPTTFAKHIYCPPLVGSAVLGTPILIGDVTIANLPGVNFQYTLVPQIPTNVLTVRAVTLTYLGVPNTPAARIFLTQLPTRGFVNAQFTLTATVVGGGITGSTIITLTINCVPQFITSSGGSPTFLRPRLLGQPSTLPNNGKASGVAFEVTVGSATSPGLFINCKGPEEILPSSLGFVTATDPEGARISYQITAPFTDPGINRGYDITQDGVITLIENLGGVDWGGSFIDAPFASVPYQGLFVQKDDVYIAAIDPVGGMSVLHYIVFYQCGPNL